MYLFVMEVQLTYKIVLISGAQHSDLISLKIKKILKNLYLFLPLCWAFIAVHGLSLVVESRGYSLVEEHGLLITVACLIADRRLWWVWALVVATLGLSIAA